MAGSGGHVILCTAVLDCAYQIPNIGSSVTELCVDMRNWETTMLRKTALSAIAAAAFSATALVSVTPASAGGYGYGYYSPGNGYYGYYNNYCRYIRVPIYDYNGYIIGYKKKYYCG
jgi:hypothetical protein